MGPGLSQHPLFRADGSTIFSDGLYAVIAGVNGPVEVQRRDELPEEAAIEVNIRPSSGVGGPRERWLEGIIAAALKTVLLVKLHPRTLIQITLQITKEPLSTSTRAIGDISILSTLLNSAFVALVDGGLPLSTTLIAFVAVVRKNGDVVLDPREQDILRSKSMHAMAFNGHGEQVLDESIGIFDVDSWERVVKRTREVCVDATSTEASDTAMANGEPEAKMWLRQALENSVRGVSAWRGHGV